MRETELPSHSASAAKVPAEGSLELARKRSRLFASRLCSLTAALIKLLEIALSNVEIDVAERAYGLFPRFEVVKSDLKHTKKGAKVALSRGRNSAENNYPGVLDSKCASRNRVRARIEAAQIIASGKT